MGAKHSRSDASKVLTQDERGGPDPHRAVEAAIRTIDAKDDVSDAKGLSAGNANARDDRWKISEPDTTSFGCSISLLDLPDLIYGKVFHELDEDARKALSLTCHELLRRCEQTFQRAPKLYLPRSRNKVSNSLRIITETENLEGLEIPIEIQRKVWPLNLQELASDPPVYAEYATDLQGGRSQRKRRHGSEEAKLWLCPHVSCSKEELVQVPSHACSTVTDTRLVSCVFPKCSLWARHAVIDALKPFAVRELCSVLKLYRIRCPYSHPKDIRRRVMSLSQEKIHDALRHLKVPICHHLQLASTTVTKDYDPQRIPILPQRELPDRHTWFYAARQCFDVGSCEICRANGSYTTWGFFARPCRSDISHRGAQWLDIELSLARPFTSVYDCERDSFHWDLHSATTNNTRDFVDAWWKWAEKVASEGFDWRARLPPQFLQSNRSALINFPDRLPSYTEDALDVLNRIGMPSSAEVAAACTQLEDNRPAYDAKEWFTWGNISDTYL